jgi:hypothetical protein
LIDVCDDLMTEQCTYRDSLIGICPDKWSIKCNYCSVVYEQDADFGDIGEFDAINSRGHRNRTNPYQMIDVSALSHLTSSQQNEVLMLMNEYASCFSDVPGLCTAVVHEIPTTPEFLPRRVKGHRIPESLRYEEERQIAELLRIGFIQESTSPMSSPIVAVVKPSGALGFA